MITGCLFHYTQCIWRKVQSLRMQVHYNEDEALQRKICQLLVLSILHLAAIDDAWLQIDAEALVNHQLRAF